jgi:protein-L-isoaspartate(D-aspartate) O-methyltransferase
VAGVADDPTLDLARLRSEMADQVISRNHIASELVAAALREIPRHLFLPEVSAHETYADQTFVTLRDAEGTALSSSSQPAIMALMLDQLGIEPGQRVLEIGAGTGYNAAVIRHAVGASGLVVSVDIETSAVERAREALAAAGYPDVIVACGDGARGYAPAAPYDRLIATVGVPDLAPAWLEQLAGDGVLVAPLDLGGMQFSVAFTPGADGTWRSRSVIPCGFIRMRGTLVEPGRRRQVTRLSDRLILVTRGDRAVAAPALAAALEAPESARLSTGVRTDVRSAFGSLGLWLALHASRFCAIHEDGPPAHEDGPPAHKDGPHEQAWRGLHRTLGRFRITGGICDDGSIALLSPGAPQDTSLLLDAVGYGPAGATLAAELAAMTQEWDAAGRPPASALRVTAWPRPATPVAGPGEKILERTWTRFAVGYYA